LFAYGGEDFPLFTRNSVIYGFSTNGEVKI